MSALCAITLPVATHTPPMRIQDTADIAAYWGVRLPTESVCAGHTAPARILERLLFERPALCLVHGPRGGGKSHAIAGLGTHLDSLRFDGHATAILGGSLSQSQQVYEAIKSLRDVRRDKSPFVEILATRATYCTRSTVSILAASPKSVRGLHVPSLKLDEVDEIDPDIRESAIGMCTERHGVKASVLLTSTWHRVAGPMAELVERGKAGAFPVDTFCAFEVLETCPVDRSGPNLENCPRCPLVQWCHADRDSHPSGMPRAKRSSGHYAIDSLIQKVQAVSGRVFESDFLCLRPKASGVWFTVFNEQVHVSELAEYNPRLPAHVAIDPGVRTGAVWFQTGTRADGAGIQVNVFADYYAEGASAETNARAIRARSESLCGWGTTKIRTSIDSAGNARTAVGPTVRGEFERAGLRGRNGLESWPVSPKCDGLQLVEALLRSADGTVSLTIHPRCRSLIQAFGSYTRAKLGTQWLDHPLDPQHPWEDLIDPLCGGLKLEFPEGRRPPPALRPLHASWLYA